MFRNTRAADVGDDGVCGGSVLGCRGEGEALQHAMDEVLLGRCSEGDVTGLAHGIVESTGRLAEAWAEF